MTDPSRNNASSTPRRGPGRPFDKGNSGRPRGARNKTTRAVEALLEGEAEGIGRKCIEMALNGDSTAMRLAMERIAPVRRARVSFTLPPIETVADLPKAVATLLAAIAEGTLSPEEGSAIGNTIALQCKTLEMGEIEQRLRALEAAAAEKR